ncbi:hypothetical protein BJ165DRAFT_1409990 [Panaeolus papilionaceus]|nr:hypothetical protein BJ165DRAFT_1409990 [Panaeolus papilionaceus]
MIKLTEERKRRFKAVKDEASCAWKRQDRTGQEKRREAEVIPIIYIRFRKQDSLLMTVLMVEIWLGQTEDCAWAGVSPVCGGAANIYLYATPTASIVPLEPILRNVVLPFLDSKHYRPHFTSSLSKLMDDEMIRVLDKREAIYTRVHYHMWSSILGVDIKDQKMRSDAFGLLRFQLLTYGFNVTICSLRTLNGAIAKTENDDALMSGTGGVDERHKGLYWGSRTSPQTGFERKRAFIRHYPE